MSMQNWSCQMCGGSGLGKMPLHACLLPKQVLKRPTAEDVMAACEVVKTYRSVILDEQLEQGTEWLRDVGRATGVVCLWLDQFVPPEESV